jgi:hypothetical protein
MVSEPQLEKIRKAFEGLPERDLQGWGLDPMGWNYNGKQESDDVDLHLLRGQSERAPITIFPEPGATHESLTSQILQRMAEQRLISTL